MPAAMLLLRTQLKVIDKSLKQRIYVDTQDSYFVQRVIPITMLRRLIG